MARDLVRLMTCGSVDDGKSTLIGRLLTATGSLTDDQLQRLEADLGPDGIPDYASLLDGLSVEREQGITVDVAYRHFATPHRAFIIADTPGHEQYTRNMVTAASMADAALVLIDAERGVQKQTRRHAYLVHLLGVKRVIAVVTKMDRVGWDKSRFDAMAQAFGDYADHVGLQDVQIVPVSGLTGDNLVEAGHPGGWRSGPSLLQRLEQLDMGHDVGGPVGFRLPVQRVVRHDDFRGYSGLIAAGTVSPGDAVRLVPSGLLSHVDRIVDPAGDRAQARAGQSVTLTLADAIDVSRGDVLCAANDPVEAADQFEATVVWMAEAPMLPGRLYDLKLGTATTTAQISDIRHELNVQSLEKLAARTLTLNAIGVCHLALGREVAFVPYRQDRTLGGFILIDRETGATVAAGMIHFALRRSHNIHRQSLTVERSERARLKNQRPVVIWLTGLSGSGKSTIANALEARLVDRGHHTALIDGDNLRHGLSRDLGFTDADRVENIRRAAETARMMTDAGLIVLVSLISPFAAERRMAREMMAPGEFLEVFVDAPLALVETRDTKGLYAKARRGELTNFTGVNSPYEVPEAADLVLDTAELSPEQAAQKLLALLEQSGRLSA